MRPDKLHDPLLAGVPHAPVTTSFDWRLVLLAGLTLLLIGLFARLRRTPLTHVDYANRADMTRLLAVVWCGLVIEWLRSRAQELSPGFWLASLALLPFVVGAVMFSLRLLRAYRAPGAPAQPAPQTSLPLLPHSPTGTKGGKR